MAASYPPPLHLLHLLLTLSFLSMAISISEEDALLAFKSSIDDPSSSLSNWSPNSTNHCNWTGITCSSAPSVISLNLQKLNLSGEISPSICQLPNLHYLNLAENHFDQPIPLHLSECSSLITLNLSRSNLWGTLPDQITRLSSLKELDVSNNRIQGQIPVRLGLLEGLQILNLGRNWFSGSVPVYLTTGLPASYLQGNSGLCGLGLPNACTKLQKRRNSKTSCLLIVMVASALTAGLMVLALTFFAVHHMSQRKRRSSAWQPVFFIPLPISEEEIMMGLDDSSIIGKGPFGTVHVIQIPGGDFVAVKKLTRIGVVSSKRVIREIKFLAKARHKNLIKLLGFYCSDGVVLLIHEYVKKGSLGDALLREEVPVVWRTRLQIALGAAQSLAYLHKDYVPHLLHRNVKSNNILLEEDFQPKMTFFGVDRLIGESSYQALMAELGSSCYNAPEQSCRKEANEKMDVYSFGVVLLELITGRPTEQIYSGDSVDVVKWVRRRIHMTNGPFQVLDPKISKSFQQDMLAALDLALKCTSILPEMRPEMDEVVRTLHCLHDVAEPLNVSAGD